MPNEPDKKPRGLKAIETNALIGELVRRRRVFYRESGRRSKVNDQKLTAHLQEIISGFSEPHSLW